MSPPKHDVPNSPDRKTSSTLFGAFKTLTGGRSRNAPPSSSPSSIGISPTDATTTRGGLGPGQWTRINDIPVNGTGSHISSQYKGDPTITKQLQNVPAFAEGPPAILKLLKQLDKDNPLSERALAAEKIGPMLQEYPVRNILRIWMTASDLLDHEDVPQIPRAAYKLLLTCVGLPDLSPTERGVFFDAICAKRGLQHIDLRLQALDRLTNSGKNVEAIETSLATFLTASLSLSFTAARESRRRRKRDKISGPSAEDEVFDGLFHFTTDVTRFNSKIFQERELEQLLAQAIAICKETGEERDIQKSVDLFHALIVYTVIPNSSLKPCVEVLCDIHRQLSKLRDRTWKALSDLLKSHHGPATLSAILSIFYDDPGAHGRSGNSFRGAIHVLERVIELKGLENLPIVSIFELLPALEAASKFDNRKVRADMIRLCSTMVNNDTAVQHLSDDNNWTELVRVIEGCMARQPSSEQETSEGSRRPSEVSTLHGSNAYSAASSSELDFNALDENMRRIIIRLNNLQKDMDIEPKATILNFFMRLGERLNNDAAETVANYLVEERLLHPSNEPWLETCTTLLETFFQDQSRPTILRVQILNCLKESYDTVAGVYGVEVITGFAKQILANIPRERDVHVLDALVDFAVLVAGDCSDELFDTIIILLRKVLDQKFDHKATTIWNEEGRASPTVKPFQFPSLGSAQNVATKALVRIFLHSLKDSANRAIDLYKLLLEIAGSDAPWTDARITAMRLLSRLRSDSRKAIFVSSASEGQSIAAVLRRTAETSIHKDRADSTTTDNSNTHEEEMTLREAKTSSTTSLATSKTRLSLRTTSSSGRLSRYVSPLWMYPGNEALPETPASESSRFIYSHIDPSQGPGSDNRRVLDASLWLELMIRILQQGADWEIYSYVLVHLGPQLTNQALFAGSVPCLKLFRGVLCDQLRAGTLYEPPVHTTLRKADVAVCLFHILTILVGYRKHFEKSEEDDIVRIFTLGIGSFDRTSKWCIHALSLCCHELPLSTSKSLTSIVQKMSQVVTQPHLAVHILEFLTGVSRLPELYKNFREEDFKIVFGVSFRYLQSARDYRERAAMPKTAYSTQGFLRHSGSSREFSSITEQEKTKATSLSDDLPQYVHALAYHVIAFWFLCPKLQDRRRLMPWISKNLVYVDRAGKEIIEEQAQVTVDMMHRTAFSDRDETASNDGFSGEADGEVSGKTWIVGLSLLTIETAGRTGLSQVTIRRPSGTRYLILQPQLTTPQRHQVPINTGLAAETFYTSNYVGILPDDILQTFYASLTSCSFLDPSEEPILLPNDDAVRRAISTFDRNSTVDNHKIGVIYIGDGQRTERDILNNVMGTADYTALLNNLGTLTRLKGAKFNTSGLDTADDLDGEFTFCWRDRVSEIVYHIPTLMPTDPENSETYANKKKHIGNDFVNIVFNNSGLPYQFSTISSAFNYVVILITPESRASFVDTRLAEDTYGADRFYKVQVLTRPEFPEISPASETKIISGKHLAPYVRLIALNASVFSQVWYIRDGGESISPWRNRLREIKKLRERYADSDKHGNSTPTPPSSSAGRDTFSGSYYARDSGMGFKRTSIATLFSDGNNRSSTLSASVEMQRTASDDSRS